jgi:anti-anti-sigma factor
VAANGYSLSSVTTDGGTVAISGEIDLANADAFVGELRGLMEDAAGEVVLDFQNCLFIDSSGIRALLVLAHEREAQGTKLKLSGVTGEPLRALELTGLLDSGVFVTGPESSASV